MSQHIQILRGDDSKVKSVSETPLVTAVFLSGVMSTGRSMVVISNGEQEIAITARNFMGLVGAVRGWMIETGEIPVKMNPGGAIMAKDGVVHFAFESPLNEFDFDVKHAKEFWRELRRITEMAERQ